MPCLKIYGWVGIRTAVSESSPIPPPQGVEVTWTSSRKLSAYLYLPVDGLQVSTAPHPAIQVPTKKRNCPYRSREFMGKQQ